MQPATKRCTPQAICEERAGLEVGGDSGSGWRMGWGRSRGLEGGTLAGRWIAGSGWLQTVYDRVWGSFVGCASEAAGRYLTGCRDMCCSCHTWTGAGMWRAKGGPS